MSFCSISGNTCEEPVVSKTGYIFERRLIDKHIQENGTCPMTGDPLTADDLIKLFQNEWDGLMLETSVLRKHLHEAREQLSDALYENDAATRVIARLIAERDEARKAVADLRAGKAAPSQGAPAGDAMDVEESGLGGDVIAKLDACNQKMTQYRKSRPISESLKTADDLGKYAEKSSHPIHKASPAGILSVAVNPRNGDQVLTGGLDKNAVLFNRSTKKVVQTLSDHTKRVRHVAFHPSDDIVVTCSQDKTCKVWSKGPKGFNVAQTLTGHTDDVVGASIHATGEYVATASADQSWAFWDMNTGTMLDKAAGSTPLSCLSFHPDGLLLAAGAGNDCAVYDVKTLKPAKVFEGHTGEITSLSFSENGYYLATGSKDSTVKLWDLRKLAMVKSVNMEGAVNSVSWDHSGHYLAAAGAELKVFKSKSMATLASIAVDTEATGVAFGPDASYLAVSSVDRNLRFFA